MGDFLKSIIDVGRYIMTRPRAERNKHVFCIILLGVIICGCFYLYEKWTNRWQLTKLERSARILLDISQVPNVKTNYFPKITESITLQIADIVRVELDESKGVKNLTTNAERPPNKLEIVARYSRVQRFCFGLIPWGIFALLFTITGVFNRGKGMKYAVVACLFLGGLIAFASMFLPDFGFSWMHWFVYPTISVLLIVKFANGSSKKTNVKDIAESK